MYYKKLEKVFQEIAILRNALGILFWDQETYMPVASATERSRQTKLMAKIIHSKKNARSTRELCKKVNPHSLDDWQKANYRLMKKELDIAAAIPAKLVADLAKATAQSCIAWRSAREQGDFRMVQGELKRVVCLTREVARIKSELLGMTLYESLLDNFEPGLKERVVDDIFSSLRAKLVSLKDEMVAKRKHRVDLAGDYHIAKQRHLLELVVAKLGFDYNSGRIDVSTHPFCGGNYSDIRITTRFTPHNFTGSLYGAIHEAGHANYVRNLPKKFLYQPVGQAIGMGVHESQSLIYERMLGTHSAFLEFLLPLVHETFGMSISLEKLSNYLNFVQPSLIRVEADEVTYPLHIMIRHKIEKALIEGTLAVEELPAVWNEEHKNYLGITPVNDREGCLQDIHWFIGYFGYFPTYTLGAVIAAQIMHHANASNSDLPNQVRKGNFSPFNQFLTDKIHSYGSFFENASSLMQHSFGEDISTDYFERYLNDKYLN